jgi:transcriptional regulator with XRE-family HTH domain
MKSVKYLQELSEKTGTNDAELARKLNLTRAAISQYRSGKRIMDNEACVAIALELGIDPLKIIIAADMDRAEKNGQHSLWEVFIQRTANATSAALVKGIIGVAIVRNFLTPRPADAATMRVADCQTRNSTNYTKSRRRRRSRAVLAWFERMTASRTLQPTAS